MINRMVLVFCPANGGVATPANSCKDGYRCTKCGQAGHVRKT